LTPNFSAWSEVYPKLSLLPRSYPAAVHSFSACQKRHKLYLEKSNKQLMEDGCFPTLHKGMSSGLHLLLELWHSYTTFSMPGSFSEGKTKKYMI
jgi:hypothetical protein